jgi:hypothetical protein
MKYPISDKAKHKIGVLVGVMFVVLVWYMCTYKYDESFSDWMVATYDVHGWLIPQWLLIAGIILLALVIDTRVPDKVRKQ